MKLAHLHLPHITSFNRVSHLQQLLTSRLLAYKKASSALRDGSGTTTSARTSPPIELSPPDPTIITFTPNPVYTTGRRDLPPSNTAPSCTSTSRTDSSPLSLSLPPALEPIRSLLCHPGTLSHPPDSQHQHPSTEHPEGHHIAEYHPTLRGGQTTYHGPGQMVAYTILDLHRLGLTPRCHIRLLENSVIDVLAGYGVKGFVTEDPGVWVNPSLASTSRSPNVSTRDVLLPKKITAVGVHLRRNISSYGIGFNVTNEPIWFFRQIVACGLEGREATSLEGQGVDVTVEEVAGRFVEAFVKRVNGSSFACTPAAAAKGKGKEMIEEVYEIREEDVLKLEEW